MRTNNLFDAAQMHSKGPNPKRQAMKEYITDKPSLFPMKQNSR
jgi:hypothetical protein